ncbi:hypothetical protein L1987_74012 [Smallanthus sonchifolius]|uniref:Uncharacterized protein n=1 Tax=Smallanthus sonchifolius TaxID=185202 RepID=A0ACB9A116_9ASTR|nr:hypothetical protein L1987_74012 [Smallanthus sonchifolius]
MNVASSMRSGPQSDVPYPAAYVIHDGVSVKGHRSKVNSPGTSQLACGSSSTMLTQNFKMSGEYNVPYYDPNRAIKQETPKRPPYGSLMMPFPISDDDDPFVIDLDTPTPEYHPQSYEDESSWMDSGSNFCNWQFTTPPPVEDQVGPNMVGKGKGPSFLRKFAPANYFERKTNETTIEDNKETKSSTFKSLGEIGNPSIPYNPSISFHSAPTVGSYNITPLYSQNFHEVHTEIPYEMKCDPEEEERADSNKFYVPYYENIPTIRINENTSRSEREQMLLNRIAELEKEKAEVEARNALLVQALEEKNFRNL